MPAPSQKRQAGVSETVVLTSGEISLAMKLAGIGALSDWRERKEHDPDGITDFDLVCEIYAAMRSQLSHEKI